MPAYEVSKIVYWGNTHILSDEKSRDALVDIIDNGPKNKLECTQTQTSITRYGVTATYDKENGIVTLNGSHITSDSAAIFEFYSGNASDQRVIPPGTYHMSGCPSGGSTSSYRASLSTISGGVDTGNGAVFTISESKYLAYRILISGNCTFNNMVFKPMVCPEELYKISDAFQPYRPSYQELYEMVKALQS